MSDRSTPRPDLTGRGRPFMPRRLTWFDDDDCLVWKIRIVSEALWLRLSNIPKVYIYIPGRSRIYGFGWPG